MTPRHWLLITVCDATAASQTHLERLLRSVEAQAVDVDLVLVMRGGGSVPQSPTVRIHSVQSPLRIALSAARNLALAHAIEHSLLQDTTIVAFPDDDASYPDGLMPSVEHGLASDCAMICGAYAPAIEQLDRSRFPATSRALTPALVMRVASSNDVFFRGDVITSVGCFDERFGLGARYGAGEDSDYVLRALRQGHAGIYDPSVVVLHPYKAHRPAEYYPGNVAVLARHVRGGRTGWLLGRRLATGLLMTVRRQMSSATYARVLGCAVRLGLHRTSPRLPVTARLDWPVSTTAR